MHIQVPDGRRMYRNFGQHAQQMLTLAIVGKKRRADSVPYNKGSDIPEFNLSVKTSRFTLMSAKLCQAQDFDGIKNEYFQNVQSQYTAYITKDLTAYFLNENQFRQFIDKFCSLEKESTKNSGKYKIRMKNENAEVINWLEENIG